MAEDVHKQIIIDSLSYCTSVDRILLHGFVIMANHVHLLRTLQNNETQKSFQRDFLKFTAQQIIKKLIAGNKQKVLNQYLSSQKDRVYPIWERRAKWIAIQNQAIFMQKLLDYTHNNPLQLHWHLAATPSVYRWRSAYFYETGEAIYEMITAM